MSSGSTRYQARFELPELIERGTDTAVRCPVYLNGQLQAPVDGSCTLYDPSNQAVVSPAAVITGGVATATIPGDDTAAKSYGPGWRIEWYLTIGSTDLVFKNDAYVVRRRLVPCISDQDVARRLRSLDPTLPAVITNRPNFQPDIDEADVELQLKLLENNRRPWLITTPSALRQAWLYTTIAIVLEGLATQNRAQWAETAKDWRARATAAFESASVLFDYDEDGVADQVEDREGVASGVVWTC